MSELENLEAGSRHDLCLRSRPAPRMNSHRHDEADGAFGYVHSYETASRCDGPGLRFVLFVSGCPLRCSYCHNPDSWHLKDGTSIPARQVIDRLAGFASALGALDGGLTISGGEPLVQIAFTRRILSAAKQMGLHTAIETSGYLGDRVDDSYLSNLDLILLDIKSSDPDTYRKPNRPRVGSKLAFRGTARCNGQARLGAVYPGAGAHGRPGQCRWHRTVRRSHEKCRVGGGAALPSARRLQVEGAQSRLQARQYANSHSRPHPSRARPVSCGGLQRPLIAMGSQLGPGPKPLTKKSIKVLDLGWCLLLDNSRLRCGFFCDLGDNKYHVVFIPKCARMPCRIRKSRPRRQERSGKMS